LANAFPSEVNKEVINKQNGAIEIYNNMNLDFGLAAAPILGADGL